jgi:site-specific DNA-methyltransferase (adenine-specific)
MKSVVLQGENLEVMTRFRPNCFAMVYMDPPFNTGKTQSAKAGSYADPCLAIDAFTEALSRQCISAWELLDEDGCLVVHIDPRTSHYVKVALDRAFGYDHFASEIIWSYRRWPAKAKNFQKTHDVLLRYVKNPKFQTWNQQYEEPSESTRKTWGKRKQRAVMTGGVRIKSELTDTESPGAPLRDVWEIPIIAPISNERVGYPTQKPEALLERLILSCTNPGDLILDPYCGSGTTLAVAERLDRIGYGIDENWEAVKVTKARLEKLRGVA